MAYFKLLIVAIFLASGSSFAGYAQLAPPVTWSAGTTAGNMYKAAANDVSFSGGIKSVVPAVINVGGKSVTMPVAYKYAANAGVFAAEASFGNPYLFAALAAGSLVAQYFSDHDLSVQLGEWIKTDKGIACTSGCFEYSAGAAWSVSISTAWGYRVGQIVYGDLLKSVGACSGVGSSAGCILVMQRPNTTTYDQWRSLQSRAIPPYNTSTNRPAVLADFPSGLPIPPGLPQILPVPLPVEIPIINPTPLPLTSPETAPAPLPQPMRVPQGEPQPVPLPVPNPNNVPQTWRQPIVDVVPAPVPGDPWRVDLQPKDIIKTDPTSQTAPAPVPVTPPIDQTETPTEEKPDLCKDNPDILACAKPELDTPDEEQLGTDDKDISITPDGFGGGGSCPSPRHLPGANVDFEFTQLCNGLSMLRPVVIAVAWLVAGLILLGVKGGSD